MNKKTSFLAGDDSHEQSAVKPIGNEDKPGTQENKHGALNEKATLNDGASSSSNSIFGSFLSFSFH